MYGIHSCLGYCVYEPSVQVRVSWKKSEWSYCWLYYFGSPWRALPYNIIIFTFQATHLGQSTRFFPIFSCFNLPISVCVCVCVCVFAIPWPTGQAFHYCPWDHMQSYFRPLFFPLKVNIQVDYSKIFPAGSISPQGHLSGLPLNGSILQQKFVFGFQSHTQTINPWSSSIFFLLYLLIIMPVWAEGEVP